MPKAETEGHLAFSWDIQIIKELSVLRGAFFVPVTQASETLTLSPGTGTFSDSQPLCGDWCRLDTKTSS